MDTRRANPAASILRQMVKKDGFDENIRMQMHENAEESTYSEFSEEETSSEPEKNEDENRPNEQPTERPGSSRMSNRTIEIQGFSPLPTRMVSTPEMEQAATLERTRQEILDTLNSVQGLCDETMQEVRHLKARWNEVEVETHTLKVNFPIS